MVSLHHTFDDLLYFLHQWKQHVLLHLHYFLILTTLSALGSPETQHNWVDQITTILHILPPLLEHTQHSFDNILHPLRNTLFYLPTRLASPLRRLLTSSRPSRLLCIFLNLFTSLLTKEYRKHNDSLPTHIAHTLSDLLLDTDLPILIRNTITLITHFTHRFIEGIITLTLGTLNQLYAHLDLSIDRARAFYPNGFPTQSRTSGPIDNCSAASIPAMGPMRPPSLLPYPTPPTSPMNTEPVPPPCTRLPPGSRPHRGTHVYTPYTIHGNTLSLSPPPLEVP